MSKGDLNSKGTPWLGGLYRKIRKMYHEVDHSMSQDTVKYGTKQLQTVGENVRKLGSHVMSDLPLPAFLASKANSASSLGRNPLINPMINSTVIDMECPADAKTKQLSGEELMSPSPEELSTTETDLLSNLKDDHWSNENLETNVEDDFKMGKHSTSDAPELTCSDDDLGKSSSQGSLTNMALAARLVEEVVDEAKDEIPSSSEGSNSTHADEENAVKSLSGRDSMNDEESESADQVAIPSKSSSLTESLHLAKVSHSCLAQKEGETCKDYFGSSSYLSDSSHSSSGSTLPLDFAGQSNGSISMFEELSMEKIDLSDNVELDRSGVVVESDMNLSAPSRRRCFNPYKFQNPFASKKRLEKDYKLLSIWYGDIDTEFSQFTQSNRTLNAVVQCKGVEEHTEWEIV